MGRVLWGKGNWFGNLFEFSEGEDGLSTLENTVNLNVSNKVKDEKKEKGKVGSIENWEVGGDLSPKQKKKTTTQKKKKKKKKNKTQLGKRERFEGVDVKTKAKNQADTCPVLGMLDKGISMNHHQNSG